MRKSLAPLMALGLALSTPVEAANCFEERAPLDKLVTVPDGKVNYYPSDGDAAPVVFFPEAHSYNAHLSPNQAEFNQALFRNMAHIVSEYEIKNLGFEADTGPLPAISRAIDNGHSLEAALAYYAKENGLNTKQKQALKQAYELYVDTSMNWQEKKRRMDVHAGQLEVSESIQAVFGQCDELSFQAYDVADYNNYLQTEVTSREEKLSTLAREMDAAQNDSKEYCDLQTDYIQTRADLYQANFSHRNHIAVHTARQNPGASTVNFGAAHVQDQISIVLETGPALEIRSDGLTNLNISDPYNGTEAKFNIGYPVPQDIDCRFSQSF